MISRFLRLYWLLRRRIGLNNDMGLLNSELYRNDIKSALEKYDFSSFNGKSILVTGATGLICSSLIDALLILQEITGIKIKIMGAGRNPNKIEKRFDDRIIPIIYNAILPLQLVEDVDFIIHGAGSASPELYAKKPVETMLSNIYGVNNLLNYCVGKKTRMVYISSSEVYGQKDKEDPFIETNYGYIDLDNIRNSYSESKRASEMLCKSYAIEYGVDVSMVRPGHVYGPTASTKDKRISSDFAYKAARGEKLEMLSAGLQNRSYCYCIDASMAILTCLINGVSGEAYNIGTEDVTSIREMAQILAKAGGVELKIKEPTKEEKRVFNPMNNSSLNMRKISEIGYIESFTAREGLEHTVLILRESGLVDCCVLE